MNDTSSSEENLRGMSWVWFFLAEFIIAMRFVESLFVLWFYLTLHLSMRLSKCSFLSRDDIIVNWSPFVITISRTCLNNFHTLYAIPMRFVSSASFSVNSDFELNIDKFSRWLLRSWCFKAPVVFVIVKSVKHLWSQ